MKEDNDYSQPDYLYRNEMLKDLISNHSLKGLKKDELIDLLGQPDRIDSGYLFYMSSEASLFFPFAYQNISN